MLYLWLRDPKLDHIAESSAEVGLLFTSVVLITGPLWAKPVWGTYWTWDARLTFTLLLWFIYVGYLLLRSAIDDRDMRARYSAVLGIMGAALVPFIHLSVYMFRTMHPMPVLLKPSAPSMPPEMVMTLVSSFCAFTLLYAWLPALSDITWPSRTRGAAEQQTHCGVGHGTADTVTWSKRRQWERSRGNRT